MSRMTMAEKANVAMLSEAGRQAGATPAATENGGFDLPAANQLARQLFEL